MSSRLAKKLGPYAIIAVAFVLILDTSLIRVSDYITSEANSLWRYSTFPIIAVTSIIGQYIIIRYVKQGNDELMKIKKLGLNALRVSLTILQSALAAIMVTAIIEVTTTSSYPTILLTSATILSYSFAVAMTCLLTQRFLVWFKSKQVPVVILYAIASISLAINLSFTVLLIVINGLDMPVTIGPHFGSLPPYIAPGSFVSFLNKCFVISSIVSFIAVWFATLVLLRSYFQRSRSHKYWLLAVLPLVYFLSQFIGVFLNLFTPILSPDPIMYGIILTILFTLTKPVGGLLFGTAFLITGKTLAQNSAVKYYLSLSAYGFVLMFVSNQAIVITSTPYPPYGLATVSYMGLSSYLLLLGIYSSAISVAQDVHLRSTVNKAALNLIDSIGKAQWEGEIESNVMKLTKEKRDIMTEQSGIESSMSDSEIKRYLELALDEVKKKDHEH